MLRISRAFAWMRWRVFMNSLERTSARNTLDRFSIATEKLGPIVAMVLLIPSGVLLLALGTAAGFGLGTGSWDVLMRVIRGMLFVVSLIALIGSILLPSRDSGSVVRLLLLPIPRRLLYVVQAAGALGDPWILMSVPLVAGVALGLAIALKFVAAAAAALAGIGFVLILIGITSLTSATIHLILRNRRRSDMVMFAVILILPMIGLIPQLLVRTDRQNGRRLTVAERRALPPTRFERIATRAMPAAPSELYIRATRRAAGSPRDAALPLAGLGAFALILHGAGFAAYRRVLDVPATISARRGGSFGGLWEREIPGLTPAASAVALAQVRLAVRSPRGRATLFTPFVTSALLMVLLTRRDSELPFDWGSSRGLALAAIGCYSSILALLPIALNQFAIDKAGFTRQMLSPLSVGELLAGKAAGNAIIAAMPAIFCFVAAGLMFPGGALSSWVSIPIGAVAAYCLFAPAAAAWSAIFPKVVDLNSIGNSGNAHQVAGLLGMLSFAICVAPAVLLSLIASRILHRSDLLPFLMLIWCAIAFGLSQAIFIPVRRLVASRRETIAQYY